MIILDTTHLDVLMFGSQRADRLLHRLLQTGEEVTTTIINVQEKADGWLAAIKKHNKRTADLPRYYEKLHQLIDFFKGWIILPFDEAAASQFADLARMKVRIGTMDLRIASIALIRDATVLTRNVTDFRKVPGLQVDDWFPD